MNLLVSTTSSSGSNGRLSEMPAIQYILNILVYTLVFGQFTSNVLYSCK